MNLIERDIIEKIYEAGENEIDSIIKKVDKRIKNEQVNIQTEETPNENEQTMKEMIEEKYSIKISEYIKEIYRQGFIDGVNLMINCLK